MHLEAQHHYINALHLSSEGHVVLRASQNDCRKRCHCYMMWRKTYMVQTFQNPAMISMITPAVIPVRYI